MIDKAITTTHTDGRPWAYILSFCHSVILSFGLLCVPVAGEVFAPDAVVIEAPHQQWDQERGVVIASGGVTVRSGSLVIRADSVYYFYDAGRVEALGEVRVSDPNREFSGQRAVYDLNQQSGSLRDVRGSDTSRGLRLYLRGGEILVQPASWVLKDAVISSTDEPKPNYQVLAEEIEYVPGKSFYARGVTLRLFGHKVLTLGDYSHGEGEAGGFVLDLIPSIGYYPQDGVVLKQHREFSFLGETRGSYQARLSAITGLTGNVRFWGNAGRLRIYTLVGYREDAEDDLDPFLRVTRVPELGLELPITGRHRSLALRASASQADIQEIPTGVRTQRTRVALTGNYRPLRIGEDTVLRTQLAFFRQDYASGQTYQAASAGLFLEHRFSTDFRIYAGAVQSAIRGQTPYQFDDINIPHELQGGLRLPVIGRWSVEGFARYDLDRQRSRDVQYALNFRDTDLTYRLRYIQRRREVAFELRLPNQ